MGRHLYWKQALMKKKLFTFLIFFSLAGLGMWAQNAETAAADKEALIENDISKEGPLTEDDVGKGGPSTEDNVGEGGPSSASGTTEALEGPLKFYSEELAEAQQLRLIFSYQTN